jgi:cobyrinic acid a,c-diamide synthase
MSNAMKRLFISATHKSSGKTTITVGLAAALAARKLKVQTFKKGPDYIDPMWHARAGGRPCFNLDYNTQTPAEIAATFKRQAHGADVVLIEGNNGLHDGSDLEGSDCNAALAKLLHAPVVLVVNASGMIRGVAPLVLGYAKFDPHVAFAGVILNQVGNARQEAKLRQAIERYTDLPVLGAIGRSRALEIRERHLGLTTPDETDDAGMVRVSRAAVEAGVDLDLLLRRAATSPVAASRDRAQSAASPDVRIAVARDAAFGFYYADDFEALARAGAECVFFDTLNDAHLPAADGLLLGGGFPETHVGRLVTNASLRAEIRGAIEAGLPTYAECGGMMYLSRSIAWNGVTAPMVGAIPADAVMHDRPQGRGLVQLEETAAMPWPGGSSGLTIPGHEFHHATLENIGPGVRYAYRMRRGTGIADGCDGIVIGNLLASFSHLRSTSRNDWARRFVDFIRMQRAQRVAAPPESIAACSPIATRPRAVPRRRLQTAHAG